VTAPAEAPNRAPAKVVLAILLVSMAGLLLEVAYTRIVSYKLWYYYSFLVIGLSLLGLGSGGIVVAMWAPLRRASTETVIARSAAAGAVTVLAGYWTIARLPMDTVAIWDYGTWESARNIGALALVCLALFGTFIAIGVIVATLLGRAGDDVGRLYFADLLGAALACLVAIPLISRLSPPQVVVLAAVILAAVALTCGPRRQRNALAVGVIVIAALGWATVGGDAISDVRPEDAKLPPSPQFYEWGPVFRVDVHQFSADQPNRLLGHDGTYGSGIWAFDGDIGSLTRYEADSRAIPFDILGEPPARELIIGSAGGQEILASLYRGAPAIEAVELNPVTVSLLTDHYADFTGHLADRPDVDLHQGDGRTYLARSDATYDLIWYVAPDSYAATNAASSGAFVLSESYLYTAEMIDETLDHLGDGGIMVIQFGELSFEESPSRTSRYVVTAREALARRGIDDASAHFLVAAELNPGPDLTTIVVKPTPFTEAETQAFIDGLGDIPFHVPVHPPGGGMGDHVVSRLASGSAGEVEAIVDGYSSSIDPVVDDRPFFWHFAGFGDVLGGLFEPVDDFDPESAIGERVLLLLLGFSVLYAAAFLLLPFLAVRRTWVALPRKLASGTYFACLGLGFMLFEITMIQRLVRFLGYPTYSLTVTLAAILLSTGIGALVSGRFSTRPRLCLQVLLGVLAVLTVFYRFGLDDLTDHFQTAGLAGRVLVALLVLAPLGVCLGMFMPLGLGLVGRLSPQRESYVAWSWAVNGFFSVIGSVLTTILSMTYGFRAVQLGALVAYAIAVVVFVRLDRAVPSPPPSEPVEATPLPATEPQPAPV
jgi:hypothetical protein